MAESKEYFERVYKDATTGNHVVPQLTDGSQHVSLQNSASLTWPNTLYVEDTQTGAAEAVLYTSGDVSWANWLAVEVNGLTATSVTVRVSLDGTNYVAMTPIDASTGAAYAGGVALAADGMYYYNGKFKSVTIEQDGAGGVTVRYAHGVI